mgnify:CR=1 FL=1
MCRLDWGWWVSVVIFSDADVERCMLPRRLVLIIAATAPNFDNAYRVMTISGELVVKTPTVSPGLISRVFNRAAILSTTAISMLATMKLRLVDRHEVPTILQLTV